MTFRNPILSGFHPDPSICRVGEEYYLVTSSFDYFPGVPIFQSRDMVNWRQIGHVLNRPSQMPGPCPRPSAGIFAPVLRYHRGTYYMISTNVSGVGNFVVTAKDPAGPWSDPAKIPGAEGIDPSLFFDDDDRCWYVGNGNPEVSLYDGHHTIWLQEFDYVNMRLIGPKRVVVNGGSDITKKPIWIEGPHLYKVGSWYYILAAEGGTGENHSVVVFRSRAITGPYESFPGNPILTNRVLPPARPNPITCTGHADLVQTQNGEWWMVLLACRPYPPGEQNYCNTGRETFLVPVTWKDDWLAVADGKPILAETYPLPRLPTHSWSENYGTGKLHWRDDFNQKELRRDWNSIGHGAEAWYSLTTRPGFLRLTPRPHGLTSVDQPAFLGIRQRHLNFMAETLLEASTLSEGDTAGFVVIQNRRGYFAIECTRHAGKIRLRLLKQAPERNAALEVRGEATLPGDRAQLRIEARGREYTFAYAEEKGKWHSLGDKEDGTILSTRRAGGFVGAYVGFFATSTEAGTTTTADFDYLDYRGT